jgi:dihydroxyacid dehydratase/phosphogluconate dehydratase
VAARLTKTVVLNVAPESAEGGPLALVQDGDMIRLDVAGRALELDVDRDALHSGGNTAHRLCYHCTDDLLVLR